MWYEYISVKYTLVSVVSVINYNIRDFKFISYECDKIGCWFEIDFNNYEYKFCIDFMLLLIDMLIFCIMF